ncbi:MAG TPA: oxygenase MpaB family protein, partial [Ktedonobacteraceae bacterium]|nr:oxygenase MpaB family protein [Ktedonobacteraceae bacterium]
AATPQSRQLAQQVLFPVSPTWLRPLLHLNAQVTCGLLPQPIREIFGLQWSKGQQRAFDLSVYGLRLVVPRLPPKMRVLPITQRLMQTGQLHRHTA